MKRGEVYMAQLDGVGSEQKGIRPVLVIQNDIGNLFSNTTIVSIMTTKQKSNLQTHVTIHKRDELEYNSIAMLEQIRTISKSRLKRKLADVDEEEMNQVNKALQISLAMQA